MYDPYAWLYGIECLQYWLDIHFEEEEGGGVSGYIVLSLITIPKFYAN